MFRYVFFASVLSLSCFADSLEPNERCPYGKKRYRATIRHIEKGGIGYEDGYTTLETFLASDPSRWKLTSFFDARGHVFDNGKWAANAGIGLRTLLGNRAYGINAYYDYRNTGRFHSNQVGAGLETLGKLFDLRINGYFPVGTKNSSPYAATFGSFSGHSMFVSQKYQSAMKGADAEIGFHFAESEFVDCYAAAGPYYFVGDYDSGAWGGKAKISAQFKDILTLEISDSYDKIFRNKFQGQISLSFSFGPKTKVHEQERTCEVASTLNDRMLQSVHRQEIVVIDHPSTQTIAIDPTTGLPYYFVFVDNTSSSDGTFESPYHSLAQAQNNSSPNNIIYVFPGDGTTRNMNSGITLKANQKLWGSGINHLIPTSVGGISIPAQSRGSPTITNTNVDTEGIAVTLSTHNAISGFTIAGAATDAIYGSDVQNLSISDCTIEYTTTFALHTSSSGNASISFTNNQISNNANGLFLTLNGTSNFVCSGNVFKGQTSVSETPVAIVANSNILTTQISNNVFDSNTTGSVRFNLNSTADASINLLNNVISNNSTGSASSLGSSVVLVSDGTIGRCSIALTGNAFSGNTSNSLYMHTSGQITTLGVTASSNRMSSNGGSALVLATPVNALTLSATDNTISSCNDNGIAVISSGTTTTGNITISNNILTNIGNSSNGIAVNQDFTNLNLVIQNNQINGCEGTGILSYAPTGISTLAMTISGNAISNCQNLSSNAASGLDIEQYTAFAGSVTHNTLTDNSGTPFVIGSTLTAPTACLTLSGNSNSGDYVLNNPGDGHFNLSPCNVHTVNVGTVTAPDATLVQSCPGAAPCPP